MAESLEGRDEEGASSAAGSLTGSALFRFDGVELDTARWELKVDGQTTPCQPLAMELLALLCTRPGSVLEKAWLLERLWPEQRFVSEEALAKVAQRLRQALGSYGERVVTVRKQGLRLDAEVRVRRILPSVRREKTQSREVPSETLTHTRQKEEERSVVAPAPPPSPGRLPLTAWRFGAATLLIVTALAAAVWVSGRYERQPESLDRGFGLRHDDLAGVPEEAAVLISKALEANRSGRRDATTVLLETVRPLAIQSPVPEILLARIYGADRKSALREERLEEARRKLAHRADPFAELLFRYIAADTLDSAQRQAAASALLAVRPEAHGARLALAHLHLESGQRAAALHQLMQIEPHPQIGRAAALIAADRASLGDLEGAHKFLAASELTEAARAYALGRIARSEGKPREAIEALDRGAAAAQKANQAALEGEAELLAAQVAAESGAGDAVARLRRAAQLARRQADVEGELEMMALEMGLAARRGDRLRLEQLWRDAGTLPLEPTMRGMLALLGPLFGTELGVPLEAPELDRELPLLLRAVQALREGRREEARAALVEARSRGVGARLILAEPLRALEKAAGLPWTPEGCRFDPPFPNRLRIVACWYLTDPGWPLPGGS